MFLWFPVLDLARAPRRTARKKGSGYENSSGLDSFSYPEPILRAVNGARQGALAKSISNWHLIGHNEGCCSNTGYILLPCFYGIRLWIWPEPLVAPRVRRALGTRMVWIIPGLLRAISAEALGTRLRMRWLPNLVPRVFLRTARGEGKTLVSAGHVSPRFRVIN